MQEKLQILTYSGLFPNQLMPSHGIFVETRLRQLMARHPVHSTVVAPVPWFPFKGRLFGQRAQWARVPLDERLGGIDVYHPRYFMLPKVGWLRQPQAQYRATRRLVADLVDRHGIQLIDAHYFYPDGVAAVRLGRDLGLPVVITARGTDINLVPQNPRAREQLEEAIDDCAHMITVCGALRDELIELGAPPHKVTSLRNGVDLNKFHPMDRLLARQKYKQLGFTIASVGHLIERKGHHFVVEAMARLPESCQLLIAGDGPERPRLEAMIKGLKLEGRVTLLGALPQAELPELYSAADVLVLASSREGWANVLLEAMACGSAVVATDVWGTRECVAAPAAGILVEERTTRAIADGIRTLMDRPPDRAATRAYAEKFSWDDTSDGQWDIFGRLLRA